MLNKMKWLLCLACLVTPVLAAETALHRAVKTDGIAAVQRLLPGAELDARDKEGKTPLFVAAEADRMDIVRVLAEAGASLLITDAQQNTLLHVAALRGNGELAGFLIENKANLALKNKRGLLPVDIAEAAGNREIVRLLVANGSPAPRGQWNALTLVLYGLYLAISIALTVWVARTLSKNGRLFLVDTFAGNEKLADAVNHLLVVGFYLINIGYLTLALREKEKPKTVEDTIETLSLKVGAVLVILGCMHFFNLFMFGRLRRKVAAKAELKAQA